MGSLSWNLMSLLPRLKAFKVWTSTKCCYKKRLMTHKIIQHTHTNYIWWKKWFSRTMKPIPSQRVNPPLHSTLMTTWRAIIFSSEENENKMKSERGRNVITMKKDNWDYDEGHDKIIQHIQYIISYNWWQKWSKRIQSLPSVHPALQATLITIILETKFPSKERKIWSDATIKRINRTMKGHTQNYSAHT